MDLTQVSVREILHYNPVSGDFYWKPRATRKINSGLLRLRWSCSRKSNADFTKKVDIHASCQNATQQNGVSMIGVTG